MKLLTDGRKVFEGEVIPKKAGPHRFVANDGQEAYCAGPGFCQFCDTPSRLGGSQGGGKTERLREFYQNIKSGKVHIAREARHTRNVTAEGEVLE